jgi:hypothetical protein
MFILIIPVSDFKKDPPFYWRVQDSIVFAGEAKHQSSISDANAFGAPGRSKTLLLRVRLLSFVCR